MKVAMGLLAVGAIFGGLLQVPKVTHVLHTFLEPTFHESRFYEELEPSDGITWIGLAVGALLALAGIALAYRLWVKDPARPGAIRARLAGVHGFFARKWYFDELIDSVVVRPFAMLGRFARDVFERVVINGMFVGGPKGRGAGRLGAVARGAVRLPALLRRVLLVGVTASASTSCRRVVTIHSAHPAFFPPCWRPARRSAPRRPGGAAPARWCARVRVLCGSTSRRPDGCSTSRRRLDRRLACATRSARRLNLWLIALTARAVRRSALWILPHPRPPKLYAFHLGRRDRRARRLPRAGPDPVRALLRPDAGAVLLSRRPVGQRRPHGGDVQARGLHARGARC
jgi:hypothetical protein